MINLLQGVKAFRQPSKKQKRKPEDITAASILAVRAKHETPPPHSALKKPRMKEREGREAHVSSWSSAASRPPPTFSCKSEPRQGQLKEHSSKPRNCEK